MKHDGSEAGEGSTNTDVVLVLKIKVITRKGKREG
jgi:hypothetical protein